MFKRILIANRGEIAVRIIRTCRDLGIWTVAVFPPSDFDSLHVRIADEAHELHSSRHYGDGDEILSIARQTGVEAIHPGYGFLAEDAAFARSCVEAGFVFVGPPVDVLERLQSKHTMLDEAEAAGFPTPPHSTTTCGRRTTCDGEALDAMAAAAAALGYPIVVKSCRGGRGRGTRLVFKPEELADGLEQARRESLLVYGDGTLYLERALWPVCHVDVQVLADREGAVVHLGERSSSMQQHNQKLVAESPAPCLTPELRRRVWQMAVEITRLFDYCGAGTVEFLVTTDGRIYFSDFKSRIQVVHRVTEMVSLMDVVAAQLELASGPLVSGRTLGFDQSGVCLNGWAMQCRINAEDPWNHYLPSPGVLHRFRLPGGQHVRVDTYGYAGCTVPERYDSLLALVVTWGADRDECIRRMKRALQDFVIVGVQTNLPLHQRIMEHPDFVQGRYTTDFIQQARLADPAPMVSLRDLAIAAAVAYERRTRAIRPVEPERLRSGWHRSARQLPG
jgi:acetyl/propionyl-CoA carboxylase alpha subunit